MLHLEGRQVSTCYALKYSPNVTELFYHYAFLIIIKVIKVKVQLIKLRECSETCHPRCVCN